MSSKGLFFELPQNLNPGDFVEMTIWMPAGQRRMQALGRVVRSDARGTAVALLQHRFSNPADLQVLDLNKSS